MVPPAPARLSTTTFCPQFSVSFCAMMRATVSLDPPAGKPTTKRTGLTGYFWAYVVAAAHAAIRMIDTAAALTYDIGCSRRLSTEPRLSLCVHVGRLGDLRPHVDLLAHERG